MHRRVAVVFSLIGGLACASSAPVAPLGTRPISVGSNERVVVDHSYLIIDSSASVAGDFAAEKALVQSFVGAMPDGTYQTGSTAFGGYARQTQALGSFDRSTAQAGADSLEHLAEGTPLDRVFGEVAGQLSGKKGRAAVVLFSDGTPTDPVGRDVSESSVLEAAAAMVSAYDGDVCIHTVQVGSDPAGAELLSKIASTTPCGTSRPSGSLQNVASLENFEREIYLGAAPTPAVAAAPRDSDGDGVYDDKDQCPGTPTAAKVDPRGCWTIPGLRFAVDSAVIESQYYAELNDLVKVLDRNPNLNLRIDGHTDSTGSAPYNQALSERRAKAVRQYLVDQGIGGQRLTTKGFGESKPAYGNATANDRRGNRRSELTAVR